MFAFALSQLSASMDLGMPDPLAFACFSMAGTSSVDSGVPLAGVSTSFLIVLYFSTGDSVVSYVIAFSLVVVLWVETVLFGLFFWDCAKFMDRRWLKKGRRALLDDQISEGSFRLFLGLGHAGSLSYGVITVLRFLNRGAGS